MEAVQEGCKLYYLLRTRYSYGPVKGISFSLKIWNFAIKMLRNNLGDTSLDLWCGDRIKSFLNSSKNIATGVVIQPCNNIGPADTVRFFGLLLFIS